MKITLSPFFDFDGNLSVEILTSYNEIILIKFKYNITYLCPDRIKYETGIKIGFLVIKKRLNLFCLSRYQTGKQIFENIYTHIIFIFSICKRFIWSANQAQKG